ncbi:MAG: hypothetical protein LBL57_01335 [Tannerella sp.]|jgi:hypothetical protein|nr:hypothetical protein [Tannerella sp.]
MKPLLFTFFAIVLCYSLFFDNEPKLSVVNGLNSVYENASPNSYMARDTSGSYTYTYSIFNSKISTDEATEVPFGY